MTETTIQELIDEIVNKTKYWAASEVAVKGRNEPKAKQELEESRDALISRITQIQREADEWHKMARRILYQDLIGINAKREYDDISKRYPPQSETKGTGVKE